MKRSIKKLSPSLLPADFSDPYALKVRIVAKILKIVTEVRMIAITAPRTYIKVRMI